jgi:hypothetical protein
VVIELCWSIPKNSGDSLVKRLGGVRKGTELADQLVLVIDGAYVNGQLQRDKGPAHSLTAAARALVSCARAMSRRDA